MKKISINNDLDIIIQNPITTLLFLEKREKKNHLIGLCIITLIVLVYILALSESPISIFTSLTVYFIIISLLDKHAYPLLSKSLEDLESFEFLLTLEDRPVLETMFNISERTIKFVYDKKSVVMRRIITADEFEKRTDIEKNTLYVDDKGKLTFAISYKNDK